MTSDFIDYSSYFHPSLRAVLITDFSWLLLLYFFFNHPLWWVTIVTREKFTSGSWVADRHFNKPDSPHWDPKSPMSWRRAGAKRRERKKRLKPTLLSSIKGWDILLIRLMSFKHWQGQISSFGNAVKCFSLRRLQEHIPHFNISLPGFLMIQADRYLIKEWRKQGQWNSSVC